MKNLIIILTAVFMISCGNENKKINNHKTTTDLETLTVAEVRSIAKEAYVYGFPIVDNARVQYSYFVDQENSDFKAPWNELKNIARVYTPEDRAIQTPNSDTPYSFIGLDLRQDAMIISIPKIEAERYWSLQLIDLYTHNFAYLGSRETGNDGGDYMVVGPNWKGETPKGISQVIYSETELALVLIRTQLFNADDLEKVAQIQRKYMVQSLSSYIGNPEMELVAIDFIKPLGVDEQKTSLEFFNQLNFQLQFTPIHPSEVELMNRFAKVGIVAGKQFAVDQLSPEMKKAFEDGIKDAWAAFAELQLLAQKGEVTSGDVFGTREFLQNNYLYRMAGAVLGIYGNTQEEAIYPSYYVDSDGNKLDGSNKYTLHFAEGELPPVNSFWSLTMYELPASLLVENPLNRYLMNSTMVSQFNTDPDGGITFFFQNESPGKNKEANWLPAPKGPFSVVMRLYWPKEDALTGKWMNPAIEKIK